MGGGEEVAFANTFVQIFHKRYDAAHKIKRLFIVETY